MKKILLIAPVCLFIFNIARASDDHLWISQIQVAGDGGTNDEFIEIYNPTDAAISLDGWSLQYKSSSGIFPLSSGKKNLPDVIIPSHGYFLTTSAGYNGAVATDHPQSTISLSGTNTGATIFLVHSVEYITAGDDPNIADKLGYGNGLDNSPETASVQTPGSEKVLLRSIDTDNNFADFTIADPNPHNLASSSTPTPPPPSPPDPDPASPPAPSAPPPPAYSLDILISEIFPNPDGKDTGEEWIELYNNSGAEVDLSGWSIDDEGDVIGKDAYVFPEGTAIPAQTYLVINLLEEHFALNNTGGDSVRLFWPDKNLSSQIIYTVSVKEDESFARNTAGGFEWTALVSKGAANQFVQAEAAGITSSAQMQIKINEIFPNPKGADSGGEWIEVKNFGTEPVYLHDWYVDDGGPESKLGSSAWRIQSPIVSPGGLAVLLIPAGKVSLNNTGVETVRLFNENKVLIDFVVYEDGKEDYSFALVDGKWVWGKPSPNAINTMEAEEKTTASTIIIINEIYPEPERGGKQEEFIELFNPTDAEVDVSGFKLADGAGTSYKLSGKIGPKDFMLVKKSDSGISLNNSGSEKIILSDPEGTVIASLDYEDAPKLQSYNLAPDGSYVWSAFLTPGKENITSAGQVSGTTLLPRTGGGGVTMWDGFVLWTIIWYIYVRLSKKGNGEYEQTRID